MYDYVSNDIWQEQEQDLSQSWQNQAQAYNTEHRPYTSDTYFRYGGGSPSHMQMPMTNYQSPHSSVNLQQNVPNSQSNIPMFPSSIQLAGPIAPPYVGPNMMAAPMTPPSKISSMYVNMAHRGYYRGYPEQCPASQHCFSQHQYVPSRPSTADNPDLQKGFVVNPVVPFL